jgi:hypothetical protein
MAKGPRDMGASVRARLLNLARERGQVFDLLLTRYALERLLYRLSISTHRNQFVLKGAPLRGRPGGRYPRFVAVTID